MKSYDVLRQEKIDVSIAVDGLDVTVGEVPLKIKFGAMSLLEALLVRTIFAHNVTVTYPGQDTSKLLAQLEEEAKKPKHPPVVIDARPEASEAKPPTQ